MLKTIKESITIGGVNFFPGVREDFLTNFSQSEALIDESLRNTKIYGRDLMMFGTEDLFINFRQFFDSGDLKELGGVLNYAQAITHRLSTTRGTHPEDRFFGVPWDNYIGLSYSSKGVIISNIIGDITEELYKDSRTSEVLSVSAEFSSPTSISVSCSVVPLGVKTSPIQISMLLGEG